MLDAGGGTVPAKRGEAGMKLSIAAMTFAILLPFATLLPAAAQGPAPSGSGVPGTAGYRPPGARPPAARPPGPPGAGYRLPGTAGASIPPGFRGPPPGVPRAGFA